MRLQLTCERRHLVCIAARFLLAAAVLLHFDTGGFAQIDTGGVAQIDTSRVPQIGTGAVAQNLPVGWAIADVGVPLIPGYAIVVAGLYTVSGAGVGIGATEDQFTFVYRKLVGDGDIVARVETLQNIGGAGKAGLMMRYSLFGNSRNAFALVTPSGIAFERRTADGATTSTTSAAGGAPVWLKLTRRGAILTASSSSNGSSWTVLGTDTIPLGGAPIHVGLAVTGHNPTAAAIATFSNVRVTSLAESGLPLPTGWRATDIGSPNVLGASAFDPSSGTGGTFGLLGGGAGIAGTWDEFHFAYVQVDQDRDLDLIARVRALGDTNAWSKAGVMIRESLTPNASHASMIVSYFNGSAFQSRPTPGGETVSSAPNTSRVPLYVRLSLRDGIVTAYQSTDGVTWTLIGTQQLTLPSPFYVGLAATGHDANSAAAANVDSVALVYDPPNTPPSVSLTSPDPSDNYVALATIPVAATASDDDGTITRVDFYHGTTLIGSDTTSPYGVTWPDVLAGTYSLTAVAIDEDGTRIASIARSITIHDVPRVRLIVFDPSPDHDTLVTSYLFEIFPAGVDTSTATPIASQYLDKQPPVDGVITAGVTTTISALPPGDYQGTVAAVGSAGSSRSAAVAFTR